jgi:hypothetical protein
VSCAKMEDLLAAAHHWWKESSFTMAISLAFPTHCIHERGLIQWGFLSWLKTPPLPA